MATKKKQEIIDKQIAEEKMMASISQMQQVSKSLKKTEPEQISQPFVPNSVSSSVVTMDKVSSILQDLHVSDIEEAIMPGRNTDISKVSLNDELLESGVTKPLGQFQRAVLEAALSELLAGNSKFTASMLFRTMTGHTNSEPASIEQQTAIDNAMTQLMYTPLHIDLKQHDVSWGAFAGEAVLDGPILPAERIKMNVSGAVCSAYSILSLPIIYRFCVGTQSMTMTPLSLLAVDDINYTQRNLAILNTLQRKIAPILYPVDKEYQQPDPISIPYADIYSAAECEGNANSPKYIRIMRSRIREVVHKILDTWAANAFIQDWRDIKKSREIVAVELSFPKKQPKDVDAIKKLKEKT